MTDWMDESEQAYKNGCKAGFERGYTEGLGDRASELLDGAIRWHRKPPGRDYDQCFVVYRWMSGKTKVYLASYSVGAGAFYDIESLGTVTPDEEGFVMWGEYRPVEFTSPGIDG